MKYLFLMIHLFLISNTFCQQSRVAGIISIHNSKTETGVRQYVSLAEIEDESQRAQSVLSSKNGQFELIYVKVPNGSPVSLSVYKKGLEVVNTSALNAVTGQTNTVNISMATSNKIADYRKKLYQVGVTQGEKRLKLLIDAANNKLKETKRSNANTAARLLKIIDSLNEKFLLIDKNAQLFSNKYSTVNLDDASPIFSNALLLFKKGDVDSALNVLSTFNLRMRTKDLLIQENFLDSVLKVFAKQRIFIGETKESYKKALQLEADIKLASLDFNAAKGNYELLIKLDTLNYIYEAELASILMQIYETNGAIEHYKNAISLLIKHPNLFQQSFSDSNLGTIQINLATAYLSQNNYLLAKNYLDNASNTFSLIEDVDNTNYQKIQLVSLYDLKSNYYQKLSNYEQAEFYQKKAIAYWQNVKLVDSISYLSTLSNFYGNAGFIYSNWHKYLDAEKYLKKAYKIDSVLYLKKPSKFRVQTLSRLLNLSALFNNKMDTINSEIILIKALRIVNEMKNKEILSPVISSVYQNLGVLNQLKGLNEKAIYYYKLSLSNYEKLQINNPGMFESVMAQRYYSIATVFLNIYNIDDAFTNAIISKNIFESLPIENQKINYPFSVYTYNILGEIYLIKQRLDSSEYYFNLALDASTSFVPYKETSKIYIKTSLSLLEIYSLMIIKNIGKFESNFIISKFKEIEPTLNLAAKKSYEVYEPLINYYLVSSWFDILNLRIKECEDKMQHLIWLNDELPELRSRIGHLFVIKGELNNAYKAYKLYKNNKQDLISEVDELIKNNIHEDFKKVKIYLESY